MVELVEPHDDIRDVDSFREELLRKNLCPRVADAVTDWFFGPSAVPWWPNTTPEPRPSELDAASRFENLVRCVGEAFRHDENEATSLLRFVGELTQWGVLRNSKGTRLRVRDEIDPARGERLAVAKALLRRALSLSADIPRALSAASYPGGDLPAIADVKEAAVRVGALHARDILDMVPLRSWDPLDRPGGPPVSDPASVGYWMLERGLRGLAQLEEVLFAEPDESVGRVASAMLAHVDVSLIEPSFGDPVVCRDGTPVGLAALRLATWTNHLVERAARREGDLHLLGATFESAEVVFRLSRQRLPVEVGTRVAKLAARTLGQLRRRARDDGASCPLVGTQVARWVHGQALIGLATTEGLGSALSTGTMLLRALREAAVGEDLRPWPDPPQPNPPERWSWLPSGMLGLIHNIGHFEQRSDPLLVDARTAFARFLVDRLKPEKGSQHGPREPDPDWRRCCIRALRELAVNPDGHVHRGLHKVIENDPDQRVQLAARSAYDELRRADGGSGPVSPRRRLMAATWWLRQAHRLELGLTVDAAGARRTRSREISRTRERKEGAKQS